MKTTVYFTSTEERNYQWTEVHKAIESLVEKRDNFFQENEKTIGKIDEEDIRVIPVANGQQVVVIIKLSYYPK